MPFISTVSIATVFSCLILLSLLLLFERIFVAFLIVASTKISGSIELAFVKLSMETNNIKIHQLACNWLLFMIILVFFIIIVGGLTRLTNSGLSITEWELFIGVIPPLNEETWIAYFEAYKKIPQYKYLNFDMTIEQFKITFLYIA